MPHPDEPARLSTLESYHLPGTTADPRLDRITHLVAGICNVPMAAIVLVDDHRRKFVSSFGLAAKETTREGSFCAHAIGSPSLFVVEDAAQAPQFSSDPLTRGPSGVRFYAGMPLVAPEGAVIGTLAVMDRVPRTLTPLQLESLETLAQQVVAQLELRRSRAGVVGQVDAGAPQQESEQRFRQLADTMPYIVWSAKPSGEIDYANQAIIDYAGLSGIEQIGTDWVKTLHPDDISGTMERWMDSVQTGEIFSYEYRLRRGSDQAYRWHLAKGMPIRDEHGTITKWYGTTMDIHNMKLAHEEIGRLAFYDPLTQLPNRQLLMDRLSHALSLHARNGRIGAVLLIDLDKFKTINDTLGHAQGDVLLDQVAKRLSSSVTDKDTVARLGGDEFVIVLEDLGTSREAAGGHADDVARKVLQALSGAFNLAGRERHVTPSIGVALFGGTTDDAVGEILKRADLAMYQAKAAGRNTICFFDPKIHTAALARAELESEMRQALHAGQFQLHYQPQVGIDGTVTGLEALVRWQHPRRGMVSPAEFIPLAEDTGLILPLGRWILQTACEKLAALNKAPAARPISMSVNVSALQFRQADFVKEVTDALAQAGASPHQLKLELTESLLVDDIENAIAKISLLREHGVLFSLDDFGTGYSSLSYLKRLPLYQLKIDQSFVRNLTTDPRDSAIVNAIITLGHTMGMSVIAEGVETAEQRDFLAECGCRAYQGYLFSRPLSSDQLTEFLAVR